MEGLLILVVLFIVFVPAILSIVALVKISNLRMELRRIREHVIASSPQSIPPQPLAVSETPIEKAAVPPTPPKVPSPAPAVVPQAKQPLEPAVVEKPRAGLEYMMGGKAAAFAGIAILVMGIVFLVGYAIQHSWIGPSMRVVLGLLSGGALVWVGHFVAGKDEKYLLFGRVLTGGGSALFYFCVFAAYGIYHLIGATAAGILLFASALAVFGLAMAYRAQSVGVLAVLGAFITPLLIGGDMDSGIFPLVYVALINLPVILLGVRRKWQVLYNLAFIFTVIHYLVWLEWIGRNELWSGLCFALLFFAEYAALGLLKLRSEQQVSGRTADLIRLVSSSLLLLGAVYWLLDDAGLSQWVGAAFLLLALGQMGLARFAFTRLSRFNGEILAFLAGGLVFATLALPAQLDGEWVSLGWAVEGAVLAWLAVRVRSRTLQAGAFLLGLIGIMKALLFDVSLYHHAPNLFLNARFTVGMCSAGLLGVQGRLAGNFPEEEGTSHWQDALWWGGVIAAVLVFFADTFWTLGTDDAFCWLITSVFLLATGASVLLFLPRRSTVTILGSILLLAVPFKILLIDSWAYFDYGGSELLPFFNAVIWIQLVLVGVIVLLLQPRISAREIDLVLPANRFPCVLNIASLAAGIGVVSIEILRKNTDWANTAVTVFWALSALALIIFGMKRRNAPYRYFGLVLFAITTVKVLLIDSSELEGIERIAAFMITGVLLLTLSFAYQKASAYFHSTEAEK